MHACGKMKYEQKAMLLCLQYMCAFSASAAAAHAHAPTASTHAPSLDPPQHLVTTSLAA